MVPQQQSRKRRRPEAVPSVAASQRLLYCWLAASLLVVVPFSGASFGAGLLHHRRATRLRIGSAAPAQLFNRKGVYTEYRRCGSTRKRRSFMDSKGLLLAASVASTDGGAYYSPRSPGDSNRNASTQQPHRRFNKKRRKPMSKRQQIRSLFRKAKTLERQGQWRQSVRVLKDILAMDPRDAHSHLALARLEARRSPDSNSACYIFQNGTTACPDSIHLWQAWAVYEESHGNHLKARALFEEALKLDPFNPYVCHAYGLMELRLDHAEQARTLWERALQKTSTAALVCSLGEQLIAEHDYDRARDLYATHVVHLPTERERTEVYLAAAWLEERYLHNRERAGQLLETALARSPRSSLAQVALARLEGRRRDNAGDERTATVRRLKETCARLEQEEARPADGSDEDDTSNNNDGRVYNAWANLEVKAKRFQEARRILYRGLARYPGDHSLLQAAGKVEERLGNFTGARELYSASLSIQPSAPTLVAYALLDMQHPDDAAAVTSNNFNDTKRLFEEALLLDKRHGPAYNAYARAVFERERDEDEARCIYERGVRANCTDSASIYHGYARLELSLGNVQRARELLMEGDAEVRRRNVGTDSPHRERAVFLIHTLGMLELNSNRPTNALQVFADGIERFGNSSQLLLGSALCEGKLGNEDRARGLFERAVLNDEKHAQAWQAWGVMEMRAGNLKTARTLFECGILSAPKHGALWQAYGVMESRLHNVENARALFEQGIKVAPKLVSLYQSWASLELREGQYNAAKVLISKALTLDKRNGSGWLIAAEIEERLGNTGLGNLLVRRGIECSPTNALLYKALGDGLVRRGKINEAREILEQGIELDPMYAPLYHSLAELEARVFNIDALAKLNKKAASMFNTNALEPAPSSFAAWGNKIRASRHSHTLPKRVAALAERIVEEEGGSSDFPAVSEMHADPLALIDKLLGSSFNIEEDLVGDLLRQNATDFSGDSEGSS